MEYLIGIILIVAVYQLYLFSKNKEKKKPVIKVSATPAILDKYKIKNRGQLFNLINSSNIPEEDRLALEDYYQKGI